MVVVVVSPGSTTTGLAPLLSNHEIQKALLQAAAFLGTETGGSSSKLQFGRIVVDPVAHRAWVDDNELALPRLEFRLLSFLCEHRDVVHTRGQLLRAVWGVGEQLTTRTVDNQVNRLRLKLGKASCQIQTVRGVGYRFVLGAASEPEKYE